MLSGISSQSFATSSVSAQSQGTLPSCLVESSGLDHTGGTHFWSLNDSGSPEIYRIASDGSLTRTVTITNASNRNWEDLAHDAGRNYMYIGDFGNNNCDRTNLRVYRIPYPSQVASNTIAAEEIRFSYPDQRAFPSPWMNFDSEGFFHFNGKLYIFTKTDGSAVGYTKMYSIPDHPGTYVATLIDSFYTNDRTTSADISPNGTSVVLISNTHIHLFRNFSGDNFFHGQHTQINISGGWTQKEAVTFSSNSEIYLTDENTGNGNHLYYINLSSWIPAPSISTGIADLNQSSASLYPVPANEYVNVSFKNMNSQNIRISLFDLTGKTVFDGTVENPLIPFTINTSEFPAGVYFYKVFDDAKEVQTARLIISH